MSQLPIGIFDSGLGGLTVLKKLAEAFPLESFIYLGDTARLPYGSKSPETIKKYLKKNVHFLTQRKVKALVVACNSASSVLEWDEIEGAPVYGVIEPGAEAAVASTQNKVVGVLGTRATISQGGYVLALKKLDSNLTVHQQACPLFVPLVEEGWVDDPLTNLVIYRYLAPLLETGVDTLVLGCTHYPLLRPAIEKVVGRGVHLVDSPAALEAQIRGDFAKGRIIPSQEKKTENLFLVTDLSDNYKDIAQRLFEGLLVDKWQLVDIS